MCLLADVYLLDSQYLCARSLALCIVAYLHSIVDMILQIQDIILPIKICRKELQLYGK